MKIAVVSDDLIQHGGQERVTDAFLDIFPTAVLYSSAISPEWKTYLKSKNVKFHVSFADKIPFFYKLYRYYAPFLMHNLAFESFNLSEYDLVLSSSSRFAHTILTKPKTVHVCYMHSPGRMFWLTDDYFKNESYGILKPLKKFAKSFLSYFLLYQRMLDYVAAQRVNVFLTNSEVVKKRIKKFYGRESSVIHPFIDLKPFKKLVAKDGDYFLVVTRLAAWKRVDIAIEACMDLNLKLKIIGDGPDMPRLVNLAKKSPLIEFMGAVPDDVKLDTLAGSKALIQTQYEDFGIVPLEANATGKVVLAYGKGGVLETMQKGKTAEFFYSQNAESVKQLLISFDSTRYDIKECTKNAERFDLSVFRQNVLNFINSIGSVY
ncbi:glycosyltransferase family 4 protein [candidate division WWE3 bacterium]|uniref:Glycosyltransferase family 4 protein n=1 Tax=candidate division WWE3 bacterium TaxID=2053526 RepID=A0A7X9DJY7_UNCKA|nr:glycosyltransferase family 4 protein [candidate division WWE3 bacterium]